VFEKIKGAGNETSVQNQRVKVKCTKARQTLHLPSTMLSWMRSGYFLKAH